MSATSTATAEKKDKKPLERKFPDFVTFAETWLFPMIAVRLAEANREGTYTWCSQWWAHRAVTVRIAALHEAFEAARTHPALMSTFVTRHVESHFRIILDAAHGPLHRCTRTHHTLHPSLTADPVPPGYFGDLTTPPPTPGPEDEQDEQAKEPPPPPHFPTVVEFVEQWLLPVTSVRLTGIGREDGYTWCRQWWRHHAPTVRFAILHRVFEATRNSDDHTDYSSLFTDHIDPHMTTILDAARGPLHRCTPDHHTELPGLTSSRLPVNWFTTRPDPPLEELGFGPTYLGY